MRATNIIVAVVAAFVTPTHADTPKAPRTPTTPLAPKVPLDATRKLKVIKYQRFKALPRRATTLPPLSTIQPKRIALTSKQQAGTKIERKAIETKKLVSPETTDDNPAEGRYCTVREVTASAGEDDKIVLGNQSDKIYPGAIYLDSSITDGGYAPPPDLQRKPYEIAISLVSARSTGPSFLQVEPTVGAVSTGIVTLMKNNKDVVNASQIVTDVSQIYSLDQLEFELQGSYQGYGVELGVEFDYNKQATKRVIFAKLTQVYFSVVLNRPEGAALVNNATPPANAVYVSKVNYGRIGILKIESSSSEEQVRAALELEYAQSGQGASLETSAEVKKVLNDIKISGFFFGGDATNGIVPITCANENCAAALDEFGRYVRNGLRLDTAVAPTPISYEMKYLNDNTTARVNSITNYTERNCEPGKGVKITLKGISTENVHKAIDWNQECKTATCNSDCGYIWGSVKVELEERKNGVTIGRTLPIFGGKARSSPVMWEKSARNRIRTTNYKAISGEKPVAPTIDNVNTSWELNLNPRVLAAGNYYLKVTTDIKANHKDNHIAKLGYHGMKEPRLLEAPIAETLYVKSPGTAEPPYGSWITPPYSSDSNRLHRYRVHFTVTPLPPK